MDRPDTNKVKAEIIKDKSKVVKHQNSEPDGFPAVPECAFKCLGLITDKKSDLLSLKSKQIYFKMGSHQPWSVMICNGGNSNTFLSQDNLDKAMCQH